ncbi:MAG: hypothetical protein J7639_25795, partial [Paenibacillaceae bacterium]|nr:hypothetical protein [Paenibacillaceae bacterium]
MRKLNRLFKIEHGAGELLRSESGAALVLAMIAVIMMTMLGLLLMDVLRNSFGQVSASEANIQAEALAQKGLDETMSLIREIANQKTALDGIKDPFDSLMENDEFVKDVPALRGSYTITLKDRKQNFQFFKNAPEMNPNYPYVAKFRVSSKGAVHGQGPGRVVEKTADIYVSTIDPVFRFPVSASQDIELYGFPYIVGNVSAGHMMFVSDQATFIDKPNSFYCKKTGNPAINGFIHAKLGYVTNNCTQERIPNPQGRSWNENDFSLAAIPLEDASLSTESALTGDQIEAIVAAAAIQDSQITYSDEDSNLLTGHQWTTDITIEKQKVKNEWVTIGKDRDNPVKVTVQKGDLAISDGVLSMKEGSLLKLDDGSLFVSFGDENLAAADLSGTVQLDSRNARVVVEGNAVLNDGFKLNGNLYVDGQLKIIGNVNIDGAIYVSGDVEMKDVSSINQTAGYEWPVIIVAAGKFDFVGSQLGSAPSNNQSAKMIRAFLYATDEISLYGVQSQLIVQGGVHGQNVKLNAVGQSNGTAIF